MAIANAIRTFVLVGRAGCASTAAQQRAVPLTMDTGAAITLDLFRYVVNAFPAVWAGAPAQVYCVESPFAGRPLEHSSELTSRTRPAVECAWQLHAGKPVTEQRVRHSSTGRPALIYEFGAPTREQGRLVSINFTWFAAYHFSGRYRCELEPDDTAWESRRV